MLGYQNELHRKCSLPQYVALAAAFAFLSVSVFLRYVFQNNMYFDVLYDVVFCFYTLHHLPYMGRLSL